MVRGPARRLAGGLGAVVGAGAVCLAVAALNWDYTACPEGPITLPPGATSFTCGGTSPWPWLLAGSVLALGAPLAYLFLRKRRPPRPALVKRLSRREKIFLALIAVLAALALLTLVSFVVLSSGSGEIRIEQSPPVGVP